MYEKWQVYPTEFNRTRLYPRWLFRYIINPIRQIIFIAEKLFPCFIFFLFIICLEMLRGNWWRDRCGQKYMCAYANMIKHVYYALRVVSYVFIILVYLRLICDGDVSSGGGGPLGCLSLLPIACLLNTGISKNWLNLLGSSFSIAFSIPRDVEIKTIVIIIKNDLYVHALTSFYL